MSGQLTSQVDAAEGRDGTRGGLLTWSGPLADVAVVLGAFVLLGLASGVLWWLLVDPATFTKLKGGGTMSELQLGLEFSTDGWYAVIAAVCGIVFGSLLTWWRSRDFLLTTVLVAVGSALAAAVMAVTGHLLGPADPKAVLAHAALGAHVPVQLDVAGKATYLVWPIAALIGALLVLWSSPRDEDRAPDPDVF
jgi:hypothetical protein